MSNNLTGAAAAYVNIGGVVYKGIEAQATWVVGNGFALYGNGSSNQAESVDTGKTIANAPDMTAALGLLYSGGAWSSSLIAKRTGAVHQVDYDATKPAAYDQYRTAAYMNTDLSVAYRFTGMGVGIKGLKLQLNVFNLFDKQAVTAISAGKTVPFDQYTFQAPRSMQVSAKADF